MSLDRLRPFRRGLAIAATSLAVAIAVAAPDGPAQAGAGSAPAESAAALAARLQTRYDAIKDFTADFTQTYEGGVLRRKTTESGTLLVKKPGRMRWEYKTPEEKLFVVGRPQAVRLGPGRSAGHGQRAARPATPRRRRSCSCSAAASWRATSRRRCPAPSPGAPADSVALALVPKTPVPDYDRLTLVVDRATLGLRMLIARDAQGGTSTFVFTNLRENVGLADAKFAFTIPRGADVVAQE